jgi:UPF0716 protein FxsA
MHYLYETTPFQIASERYFCSYISLTYQNEPEFMPFSLIPLLLLIIPILEISVFILVGGQIGVFPTLGMILVTAILGTFFLRQQGLSILQKLQSESRSGNIPGRELVHGAMIMIAGVLLLTPGFVTDSIGFLLFFPPFRDLAWNFLKTRINVINVGGAGFGQSAGSPKGPDYQGEPFVDLNADEYSREPEPKTSSEPNPDSPWIEGENKQK